MHVFWIKSEAEKTSRLSESPHFHLIFAAGRIESEARLITVFKSTLVNHVFFLTQVDYF